MASDTSKGKPGSLKDAGHPPKHKALVCCVLDSSKSQLEEHARSTAWCPAWLRCETPGAAALHKNKLQGKK